MPSQEKSRPLDESIEPEARREPRRIASLMIGNRSVVVYTTRIVVKSATHRVETSFHVTDRERFALAAAIRPPVTSETPVLQSGFSDEKVSAQEWLREYADVLADAEEKDVVVTDAREDDVRADDFTQIARYIDWLEESLIERNKQLLDLLSEEKP
jgi:hypothetical protein